MMFQSGDKVYIHWGHSAVGMVLTLKQNTCFSFWSVEEHACWINVRLVRKVPPGTPVMRRHGSTYIAGKSGALMDGAGI